MKRFKSILSMVGILALLMPVASFGAVKTIPDSSVTVGSTVGLKVGIANYTATWSGGIKGKTVTTETGQQALMIPIKNIDGAWSYSNFLDVTFKNAGSIDGRSIDVKLHFNSISVDEAYNKNNVRSDKHMCVMVLNNGYMNICASHGSGLGYQAAITYDITTTVVWSDTQQVVNLPFFMAAIDIDAGNNSYKEAWEGVSGFSGNYYVYKENILNINGNKFTSVGTTTSGNDMYLKTGVYAPTANGSFRMKFYAGSCSSAFLLYSQYQLMSDPVKSIR